MDFQPQVKHWWPALEISTPVKRCFARGCSPKRAANKLTSGQIKRLWRAIRKVLAEANERACVRASAQNSKCRRGHSEDVAKHAGEVKRISKPRFLGRLLHQDAGLLQTLSGMVHFQAQQILVGTLVVIPPEQAAEIGLADVTLAGDLFQRPQTEDSVARCAGGIAGRW